MRELENAEPYLVEVPDPQHGLMGSLTNAQLAELLARGAEDEPSGTNRHKALLRASRAALFWPEEAADVVGQDRPLTELRAVGPWLSGVIGAWLGSAGGEPPDPVPAPEVRRGFLTLAEVRATLAEHPEWRAALRADLQMHTTFSDGKASLREMAATCAEVHGYRQVAVTDHSKGLPIALGMDEARLAVQGEEVRAVNAELEAQGADLRVLHGLEMNLSPEGEGDMDPGALRSLDLVLGAFHSKLRLTDDQTERYLAALRNPTFHVLAHPRGRRWGARVGLRADWPTVFEEAAAQGKALEIDAYPDRQDLDVELLRLAREAGAWISIGTDAHHPRELQSMEFGLAAAIRAGIPRERILNFLPRGELMVWTASRRA
ncbi:MAG TPA: PHP domain-containing protein [Actinomycetota bacterium]